MDEFEKIIRQKLAQLEEDRQRAKILAFEKAAIHYKYYNHHGPEKGEGWKEGYFEMRAMLAEIIPSEETRALVAEHTGPDGYITLYRGCSKYEARRVKANKGFYPAGLFWTYSQAHAATYARGGRIVKVEIPAIFVKIARVWPSGSREFNFNLIEAAPYVRGLKIIRPGRLWRKWNG